MLYFLLKNSTFANDWTPIFILFILPITDTQNRVLLSSLCCSFSAAVVQLHRWWTLQCSRSITTCGLETALRVYKQLLLLLLLLAPSSSSLILFQG